MTQDRRLGGRKVPEDSWLSTHSVFQSSQENIIEVLAQGPDYPAYAVRVQVHQPDDTVQCLSEVRAGLEGLHTHNPKRTWQCRDTHSNLRTPPRLSHSSMTKKSAPPLLPPATWEGTKTLLTYL